MGAHHRKEREKGIGFGSKLHKLSIPFLKKLIKHKFSSFLKTEEKHRWWARWWKFVFPLIFNDEKHFFKFSNLRSLELCYLAAVRVSHSDITRDGNGEKVNIMFSSCMNTAIYSKQTQILLFILLYEAERYTWMLVVMGKESCLRSFSQRAQLDVN